MGRADLRSRDEAERLHALKRTHILDTAPEPQYDRLAQLAAQICKAPIALVSFLDAERQWFKARVGLDATETSRDSAFCAWTIQSDETLIVPDVARDRRFRGHPFVKGEPFVRAYAGAPIFTREGHRLGSLCVLHREPFEISADQAAQLRTLADLAGDMLHFRAERFVHMAELEQRVAWMDQAEQVGRIGHWRVDLQDGSMFWSDEARHIFGVAEGRTPRAAEDIVALFPEDERSKIREDLARLIEHRKPIVTQRRIRRPDGAVRTIVSQASCSADDDGRATEILGVVRDVTEECAQANALRENEERFALAVKGLGVGISVWRPAPGGGSSWSDQFYRLIGYEPGEIVASLRTFTELLHPDDRERAREIRGALVERKTGSYQLEYRLQHRTLGYRWFRVAGHGVWDSNGELVRVIGALMDIDELRRARERAEAANVAKSQFLATMSHEIRTPLNGVLGMAQALEKMRLDERQAQMIKIINDSGRALLAVVNDVLDLSRIEAGRAELSNERFNLRELIRSVAAPFEVLARNKNLDFRVHIDDRTPGEAVGDPVRIRQVINNFVSNAIKFTDEGGVSILVGAEARSNDGRFDLRVAVTDTGIGIEADALAKLFTPFTQVDGSNTRRYGGTGLGLAISKRLCEMMDGDAYARSVPGAGSTFEFCVALAPVEPAFRDVTDDGEGAAPLTPDGRTLRILCAEDHAANRAVLEAMLGDEAVELTLVEDGLAAIEAAAAQSFDVILMDAQMPKLDGLDATRRIRAMEAADKRKRIPIIAVSANAMRRQVDEMLAAGMDAHVAKPLEFEALRDAVRRVAAANAEQDDRAGQTERLPDLREG